MDYLYFTLESEDVRAPLKYNQTRRADGIIHVCMLKKIVSSKTIKRKHPILK